MIEIENIQESKEFLKTLLNSLSSGVFLVDRHVRVRAFNDSFRKIFSGDKELIAGNLCGNTIGCSYQVESGKDCGTTPYCSECELRKDLIHTLSKKVPVRNHLIERYFYLPNGKLYKVFMYSSSYVIFNEESIVMLVVDDITDLVLQRKELEEKNKQLSRLNEQKNRFLGMAAHDLRNPLAAISIFTELLAKDNGVNESEKQEFLQLIRQTTNKSLGLLNDLLSISRIESGTFNLECKESDYREFLNAFYKIWTRIAHKKNIELQLVYNSQTTRLTFDSERIYQVLENLVSNAVKFSPENSRVIIQVSETDLHVITEIIDFGPGIPEEEQNNLFQDFKRTSVKPTGEEISTGLGLAIAKRLISAHGGEIGFRSEPGNGSTFYFCLKKKQEN